MKPRLPPWLRVLLGLHGLSLRLERLTRELLSTVAWACTPPARRDAVTSAVYRGQPAYLPGGATFERGLFPFEEEALARPEFPRSGRILLGGAGGGRELKVLAERGYAVLGFEPVARLAEACAKVARGRGEAACLQGSYADMVQGVLNRGGPLALLVERTFDAVILGWGSFANVTEPGLAEAVLAAARVAAPRGPVFTNFYPPSSLPPGRAGRLGARLARLLARLGAPGTRPPGGAFIPLGGFAIEYTLEDLATMAARQGYRVAAASPRSPAWVLLVPERHGALVSGGGPEAPRTRAAEAALTLDR